jgi:PTS system mannose-specific IID component
LLQASWTYERMQGVGIGFASLPLLEPLRNDPGRHLGAVTRSSEYFNAHPYLAPIAVGAAARAELDGAAAPAIQRLKSVLAGPLGGLGDQLFWAGLVPGTTAAMIVGVALGGGLWVVVIGVLLYVATRWTVTLWGLDLGLGSGLGVVASLKASHLQSWVRWVVLGAGLMVGLAIPLVSRWMNPEGLSSELVIAMAVGAAAGIVGTWITDRRYSARTITALIMIVILVLHRSLT